MEKLILKPYMNLQSVHAASGLVKLKNFFYAIADDQLSLAIFSLDKKESIKFIKLLPGELPIDHDERKKLKPDWESLVCLSSEDEIDTFLVLPSGSTLRRKTGVLVSLKGQDLVSTKTIDFSILYHHLRKYFSDLNIEGAVIFDKSFKIFQRGNGASCQNAIIDLNLTTLINDVKNSGVISEESVVSIKNYDLGTIDSVPLSFTDACFCESRVFFLAAAESSASTYEDGEYKGAVLGCLDRSGQEVWRKELICPFKPEGLSVEVAENQLNLFVVTDADNSEIESGLYTFSGPYLLL